MINTLDIIARKYNTDKKTNDAEDPRISHGYSNMYSILFNDKREKYKTILEIGVAEGASHRMWYEYFPNAMIYGIDNFREMKNDTPESRVAKIENDRIKLFVGDQTDASFLISTFKDMEFDLIIDDGGHGSWQHQISFRHLFSRVKSGGYYIIEDMATCLMREFREFDDEKSSSIPWLKSIRQNKPFSYYIPKDEMDLFSSQIEAVDFADELGIILKK
jgi:hypothetical protein